MKTNRSKILNYMQKRGYITKAIAAGYKWSYGLGDHILDLRKNYNIETVMCERGKSKWAMYVYKGVKRI